VSIDAVLIVIFTVLAAGLFLSNLIVPEALLKRPAILNNLRKSTSKPMKKWLLFMIIPSWAWLVRVDAAKNKAAHTDRMRTLPDTFRLKFTHPGATANHL
jgi:hypothetical protein